MQSIIVKFINQNEVVSFIKNSFLMALLFSALLSITFCLLFAGFRITPEEAGILFVKTFAITWLYITAFKVIFSSIIWIGENAKKIQLAISHHKRTFIAAICVVGISAILFSCKGQMVQGVAKDVNTGMTTTYSGLKPEKTVIVMNDEVINHNQIPLGESFVVINDNVKGLTVKDNKVSVGCSLTITDSTGKQLLNEPDLFKNDGIYDKDSASYLKCTVSTGKPMEWDTDYKVSVKFWDKYGSGTIENNLTINTIDIP